MKFSVLIPAYKQAFLKEAILSVLNQTIPDWELVILNDHSPEDIKTIVDSFNDNRIKYYENDKNVGAVNVVENWNKCLKKASGDFVICMGDDDVLESSALSTYESYINKYPNICVFHTPSYIINEFSEKLYVTALRPEHESAASFLRHRIQGEEQFIGDNCFKRSILNSKGGFVNFPLAWGADDVSVLECIKEDGIVNLQTPVFNYRASMTTITSTGNTSIKLEALVLTEDRFRDYLCQVSQNNLEAFEAKGAEMKIGNYFSKRHIFTLAEDILIKKYNVFKWIFHGKKYRIKFSETLVAFAVSFKLKNHGGVLSW